MSSFALLGIALAVLLGAFVMFVVVPRAVLAGMRGALEERVRERYPDAAAVVRAEYSANSFGVQSLGLSQWRGNGALVLTEQELCFFQFTPERELILPLKKITGLRVVHSHLGKATPSRLLRIEFEGKAGPDAVAYWLPDPEAVLALLEPRVQLEPPTRPVPDSKQT